MSKKNIFILAGVVVLLGVGFKVLYNLSVIHVTYMTGGVEHPINCISCHGYPQREGMLANMLNEDYLSPLNTAVSADGQTLYVVAQDADLLLKVDLNTNEVVGEIPVGRRPHSVLLSKDQSKAYVSNQWAANIYILDLNTNEVIDSVGTGGGPAGMDLSPDGSVLYVANTYANNISLIDIAGHKEIKRLHGGNYPTSVAASSRNDFVYAVSQRTLPIGQRETPITELTIINAAKQRIALRRTFESAHIMENVAVTPSGDMVVATLIRPKNNVPSAQIERGWMMNHGIGIIMEDGRMAQLLLDEPNACYPDPYDVVIHPDGKSAYVSHAGVDVISVINLDSVRSLINGATDQELARYANHLGLSDRFVVRRISTGANPRGLALSPDGSKLYVAEQMTDHIAVIDTRAIDVVHKIDLGGPKKITVARRGGQLFRNAGHTYHNQYSCYTCHPDGHEDGLTYDLTGTGRNLANVQTLRDLHGTGPFKWVGTNQSIYKQCGMRFSMFVTRSESFSPHDLDAVVAYIKRELTHPPNIHMLPNGELTEAQQRGKQLYERTMTNDGREIPMKDRCTTCHSGPNFSNYNLADVGTLKDNDDPNIFDAPNLNNIYESAPYLHDGSAATLEEIWTVYNDEDMHGFVNDMTKDQLNDLVEYLKSLGAERYYKNEMNLAAN